MFEQPFTEHGPAAILLMWKPTCEGEELPHLIAYSVMQTCPRTIGYILAEKNWLHQVLANPLQVSWNICINMSEIVLNFCLSLLFHRHSTLYNGFDYISMLGFKLIHVSKRGYWPPYSTRNSDVLWWHFNVTTVHLGAILMGGLSVQHIQLNYRKTTFSQTWITSSL